MSKICFYLFTAMAVLMLNSSTVLAGYENKIPDELQTLLEHAQQFELLSIYGHLANDPPDSFHGWKILGKTTIEDEETRRQLLTAFKKGVEENKGIVAACFNPRHGIRVTYKDKTADFVICFECASVHVFVNGRSERGFLVTGSPQSTFNSVLKQANIPLG